MLAHIRQTTTRGRRLMAAALAAAASLAAAGPAAAQAAVTAPAQAAPATAPTTITFDDAVRIALRQNTAVLQAQNSSALDAATVRQQKLQFLPDVRLSTSASQNLGRNFSETEGAIVNQTTQSVSAGISSSVTLFNGLQNVASLKQAQLGEEAGESDLARAKQTAVFTVASNFLALITQQEQLRVQQENLAAQQAQEQQIQKFVDAGSRAISDLYQQQASVASARSAVVEAQRALELAKVDVIQTLQLDPRGTYSFAPPVVNDSAAASRTYDLDSLMTRAFATRADLAAEASRVSAAGQGVKAAQGSRWPTLSLTAGYSSVYSSATDVSFADQLDQRRGGSIGIGVSIPLFDRGSTDLATQRALIDEGNAKLALATQRQDVALQVRRAYLDNQAAQQQLAAAQAQQRAADLAVSATQERYRVGAATLVELTQARATQVQAASAAVNARYNLVFQQALMSYYTGELNPASVAL
jgi:outer membrane protein